MQAGEFALDNDGGVVALLGPLEEGQVALQENLEVLLTVGHLLGREGGLLHQGDSVIVFEDAGHKMSSQDSPTFRVEDDPSWAKEQRLQ